MENDHLRAPPRPWMENSIHFFFFLTPRLKHNINTCQINEASNCIYFFLTKIDFSKIEETSRNCDSCGMRWSPLQFWLWLPLLALAFYHFWSHQSPTLPISFLLLVCPSEFRVQVFNAKNSLKIQNIGRNDGCLILFIVKPDIWFPSLILY